MLNNIYWLLLIHYYIRRCGKDGRCVSKLYTSNQGMEHKTLSEYGAFCGATDWLAEAEGVREKK